jgi:hypothetical protein
MLAHAPAEYRGGTLVGFVRRIDDRRCRRDRDVLGRISIEFPDQPLLPYVIQADSDQKEEVRALFLSMGFFISAGAVVILACRKCASAANGQPRERVADSPWSRRIG